MIIKKYDGAGNLLSTEDDGKPVLKSVYTKDEFIAKIPKDKIKDIRQAIDTNSDIDKWVFNLPLIDKINLNNLPEWFTDGLAAMVTEDIFTQGQVNNFLEL